MKIIFGVLISLLLIGIFCQENKEEYQKKQSINSCLILLQDVYRQNIDTLVNKIKKLDNSQKQSYLRQIIVSAIQKCQYGDHRSIQIENQNNSSIQRGQIRLQLQRLINQNINFKQTLENDQQMLLQEKDINQFLANFTNFIKKQDSFLLFGYNLKDLPYSVKYYYQTIYAFVISLALYYGLKGPLQEPKTKQTVPKQLNTQKLD